MCAIASGDALVVCFIAFGNALAACCTTFGEFCVWIYAAIGKDVADGGGWEVSCLVLPYGFRLEDHGTTAKTAVLPW